MTSYQLKLQTIYCGDNLKMVKDLPDESIDLCYIDPPFNSNRNYETFCGDVVTQWGILKRNEIKQLIQSHQIFFVFKQEIGEGKEKFSAMFGKDGGVATYTFV
ncbi:MAG TPA: hypothetical protein VIK14_14810 [Ignavibacteria bacterium]